MSRPKRTQKLCESLSARILVLDGAMGTAIQEKNLAAEDFGGEALEGCNENLVLTRPDIIRDIHESYLQAGADIVETNTFGATPLVLDEYGLGAKAHEINLAAARLARESCEKYDTADRPRFVAGSIGPTTKAISVTGGVTFEGLQEHFYIQAKALLEGDVDYFLIETCQDTRNVKAALLAMDRLFKEAGFAIPVAVSGTIEPMGTMLAGQSVEALFASLAHRDLLYIGLNCATGPEFMTDPIRSLATLSHFRVACVPNAGLPDEYGNYLETPQMVAQILSRFVEKGWINLLGGCCGTGPDHIKALAELAAAVKPGIPKRTARSFLSGVDYLEVTDEMRPVIVGERTNVIGSRKFKTLICGEKFEEASEVGRLQIKNGAQIIDICLANPDRDEMEDMKQFLEFAAKKIRVPWMIDSTDEKVIAMALTYSQGKAIINSINLEDGEERYEKVIPLAKKFGAALVVGTIDDDPVQGMAVTRERKLAVAERSFKLLTEKYGIRPEDIYWDPLVFPCATGDQQYVGSAAETIEGIRLIKRKFPETKTILGISNVSFGLPAAGREVLNSVFLYDCVKAGLDLAIVNSEKLVRYAGISAEEIRLAEDLLYNRGGEAPSYSANSSSLLRGPAKPGLDPVLPAEGANPPAVRQARAPVIDPIAAFAAHFRERKNTEKTDKKKLPLLERLPSYIIEGSKEGLVQDLNEALQTMKPLDIINGPLMQGMDEVGRLFNSNQLIVAEVLQSAEAMKAAVAHLEPSMEKSETASRGKVLLATVKGDVHDIGKNLVEIILANNGFEVINLGIKVPPEQLIQAIREHQPNIVGLSGLLVKSAQQMVVTADDFAKAGVSVPVLVGGAALSSNFVDKNIAKSYTTGTVAYASDAMSGLELAKMIVDPDKFEKLKGDLEAKRKKQREEAGLPKAAALAEETRLSSAIRPLPVSELPHPSDFKRHVIRNTPIEQIWKHINPLMLYGRHLGIKGNVIRKLEKGEGKEEAKALEIWNAVEAVKEEYAGTAAMQPAAVYQFFKVSGEGNRFYLYPELNSERNSREGEAPSYSANSSSLLRGPAKPGLDPALPAEGGKSELCSDAQQNQRFCGVESTRAPVIGKPVLFDFPRQQKGEGLCLADYAHAAENGQPVDSAALFVVTVGKEVRELSERLKKSGDYLHSHILQALVLESAEGYAELLHGQIRKSWGFSDPVEMTMMGRFQAKYRGKRYSFGYPACPRLEDQALLWALLKPEEIGIQLTDGFMMDPEASVSALVFHHPQATYFSTSRE